MYIILRTFPWASIDLNAHAQRAFVRAVGHDANFTGDDGRPDLTQLSHEGVTVTCEYL